MSVFQEIKVRVKNTFLELVEDEEAQPKIARAQTDSKALRSLHLEELEDESSSEEEPKQVQQHSTARGLAVAAAVATVSAARLAAQTVAATVAAPQSLGVGALPAELGVVRPLEAIGMVTSRPRPDTEKAEKASLKDRKARVKELPEETEEGVTADAKAGRKSGLTTVMLRNLPNDYTRDMLLELLAAKGLSGRFDFCYLPVDFTRRAGLGYAFVNMVSAADAQLAHKRLEGFKRWAMPSSKVCTVGWSNPTQGLAANIERYRNSPIMHQSVPEEFKPVLFVDGRPAKFPEPTRKLRRPDLGKLGRQ